MQLRRFTAESTPAALGAVRLALGDDAIILANRKIGDQVEIIATGQMDDAQSLADISLDNVTQKAAPANTQNFQDHNVRQPVSEFQASDSNSGTLHQSTTIEQLTAEIDAVEKRVEPLQIDPL